MAVSIETPDATSDIVKQDQADINKLAGDAKAADQKVESTYDKYTQQVAEKKSAAEAQNEALKKAKANVKSNDAENAAGEIFSEREGGQVISISEALQLVDQEQEIKAQYRQLEADTLKANVEYLGHTVTGGVNMMLAEGDDILSGITSGMKDGVNSNFAKATAGIFAGSLIAGTALQGVGGDFIESKIQGMSTGEAAKVALMNAAGLEATNEVDEDVETKKIAGEEEYSETDAEEKQEILLDRDVEEKETPKDEEAVKDDKNDIFSMNKEETMAYFEDTISKYVTDDTAKAITQTVSLVDSIADSVSPGVSDKAIDFIGAATSSFSKLKQKQEEMDSADQKNNQPQGPDYT